MENKVIDFEDKGIKYILLKRGEYLIDGNVVSVDSYYKERVKVKNEKDVRMINKNTIIDHYLNSENGIKITESEYSEKIRELYDKKVYADEYDEDGTWETLEDEFAYRKFKTIWKPIRKDVQVLSEPLLVEVEKNIYNTNNKFIVNGFLNGDSDTDLYVYKRESALKNIVRECFKELKMAFESNCHYAETSKRKIWGMPEHGGIRYVVAFGEYVFGDEFKNVCSIRGTLEDMKSKYEHDKNSIRKVIKTKYVTKFGEIDEDKVDFKQMLKDLYYLRGEINSIEAKKNSWSKQNSANRKVNSIIDYLEDKFEEK